MNFMEMASEIWEKPPHKMKIFNWTMTIPDHVTMTSVRIFGTQILTDPTPSTQGHTENW